MSSSLSKEEIELINRLQLSLHNRGWTRTLELLEQAGYRAADDTEDLEDTRVSAKHTHNTCVLSALIADNEIVE